MNEAPQERKLGDWVGLLSLPFVRGQGPDHLHTRTSGETRMMVGLRFLLWYGLERYDFVTVSARGPMT